MKTIPLNNLAYNGVANLRNRGANVASNVRNYLVELEKLKPYRDTVTETLDSGTLADQKLTDVIRYNYSGSTTQIFALGRTSSANAYPKIYQKTTTNSLTSSFQAVANGQGTDGEVTPGSLVGYKGAIYCLKTKSGSTYLMKHVYATSFTEIGSIGLSPTNGVVPQMFVHPKDNKIYIASGYTMGVFDGTTILTRDFSTAHNITGITWQGNFICMAMSAKDGSGTDLAIWDGTTTSSELVDVVDFGNEVCMVLDNLNDVVIGVCALSEGGASDAGVQNNIIIRAYAGGSARVVRRLESIGSLGSRVYPFKATRDGRLYFPMSVYLNGTRVHQIWSIRMNGIDSFAINPDRKVNNDTELTTETVTGFSMVGDYFWVAFSDGSFRRTQDQNTFTSTSSYETVANPQMDASDLNKKKQLKAISLLCGSPEGASHTVTISYSVDGGAYTTIYTGASSAKVRAIENIAESTGTPFLEGVEYVFKIASTGNGELYSFKYGYEVLPTLI